MFETCKHLYRSKEYETGWPLSYHIESAPLFSGRFKPFIQEQLEKLKELDQERRKLAKQDGLNITYIFHEHVQRVASDIERTCQHIGLQDYAARNMYWAALAHDIGKAHIDLQHWRETKEKPSEELKALRRTHTTCGAQIIQENFDDLDHLFIDLMLDLALHHHEQMNAQGTLKIPARELSLPAQLIAIVEAFDGWSIPRAHYGDRDISPQGVLERMRNEKGEDFFNMTLFESFAEMKMKEHEQEPEPEPYDI
ncbi:MAG: HD-GYP domain-containing protein [Alphaproteobacteria bacterium]